MSLSDELSILRRRNRRLGLIFGLLMSLAFSLTAWGVDGLRLYQSAGFLPWFKLAVGGGCALLLGSLVGWLIGHLDHAGAGLIGWTLFGLTINTLAGHLPYEGYSLAAGLLDGRFRGLETFPYVAASGARQVMASLLAGGLMALAGLLEPSLLEQARGAPSRLGQTMALLLAGPAFLLAGYWTDDWVNRPLRDPQIAVADLLHTVLYEDDLSRQERLDLHVGALNPITDMLSEPRLLMVRDYDAQYLTSAGVEIQFESGWAYCYVIARQMTFCQPSDLLLTDAFRCVLSGGESESGICRGQASPEAEAWLTQARPGLGSDPELEVAGRMGAVTLLEGRTPGGPPFTCRLYGAMPALVGDCAFEGAP